jgi:hypothetical protein
VAWAVVNQRAHPTVRCTVKETVGLSDTADYRDRNTGIHVADDEAHLVALDQLPRLLHPGADIIGGVLDQKFDRPVQNAALLVDLLGGEFCAYYFALCDRGVNAGQRIHHSDLNRGFAAGFDDEG